MQRMMLVLHFYVLLASTKLLQVQSQDSPQIARITSPSAESASVNGSSLSGHCSNSVPIAGNTICREPSSSILIDDNIPTLSELDGNMWASQLLTLQKSSQLFPEIHFELVPSAGFTRVSRVEVVLFNCPEWGIAVESIKLLASLSISDSKDEISAERPTVTSCDSLVRLCLPGPSTLPILTLQFSLPPGSTWVHLAEVTFFEGDSTCPSESTVNTPPPPLTTEEVTTLPPTMAEVTTLSPTMAEVTTAPVTTTTATTQAATTPTPDVMTTVLETSQATTDPETTPDMTTAETTPMPTTSMATEPASRTTTSAEVESPLTSDPDSNSTPIPGTPLNSDLTTSGLIQKEACSTSIIMASVITAIATALLATVIFVLVQIAVCKCHPKFTPDKGSKTAPMHTWMPKEETKYPL